MNLREKKLREEYISTLPANKQLAIYLHSKLCTYEHTSYCGWYYEINGLEDDWDRFSHKEYLEKADNILSITSDIELVKKLIDVIRK